jgi:hypothetical protein
MSEAMVDAMRPYTPDVLVRAEPALMRRWSKAAELVDGKLVVWDDPRAAA